MLLVSEPHDAFKGIRAAWSEGTEMVLSCKRPLGPGLLWQGSSPNPAADTGHFLGKMEGDSRSSKVEKGLKKGELNQGPGG
jgi:hypothetical protein